MTVDDELVQAFLEESRENLDQLDLDLVALEATPDDPELLARVFRTVHTVKGTCGFLGYGHLEALAHAGEDLLAALRDGALRLDGPITDTLLKLVDEIRGVLAVVERTGEEGNEDHAAVIAELRGHLLAPQGAPQAAAPKPADPLPDSGGHEETTVRIDVEVLDRLQDLVGELTLARLRAGEHVGDDGPLARAFHQLTITTRDLQETVMLARLQPLSAATDRLRRIVRDLASRAGKQVELRIVGDDVTVDKAINEVLRDPLLHLVRNAIDHGIETPAQRMAAGKPTTGTLSLRAAVVGGGVRIQVTDDGRGIDADQLVTKAIAAGLLSQQRAATMTDADRMALLFLPGISTATQVTTVSGRGVGMDVVRASLEQVGGSIELSSQSGVGTTFTIDVPLTLAILPALIIDCGNGRYTIPQADVRRIIQLSADDAKEAIAHIGAARFLRHEGTLLPLVDLADYLGVPAQERQGTVDIVVIHRLERTYGLIVDAVGDTVEAVVKPLPRALRGLSCYAGVTVLSDGRPCLILEAAAPATDANVAPHVEDDTEPDQQPAASGIEVLTITIGDNHLAVPLGCVDRLIQAPSENIEHSGHDEVLQHGSTILPLIRVGRLLGLQATDTPVPDQLTIAICTLAGTRVGLVVDAIVDIHRADPATAEPVDDPCVIGRLIVGQRVTELLDVPSLIHHGLHGRGPR